MKKSSLILNILWVLAVVVGLNGCGPKTAGPSAQTDASKILIGLIVPLTGEAATYGVSTKQGAELAAAEINTGGGLLGKQIAFKIADDKGDPTEGAAAYTRLIDQDKVAAIIGAVMSKVSLAGAPICQSRGVPMITSSSTNPKVTEVGDYIFRACFIDPFQGTVGATFAFNDLKVKKAACIFDVGNDYTKGLSEFFRDRFSRLGGRIVGFEAHPTGATDFNAQLTKMIAAQPELIYISDYYNDVGLIAKQARDLGFKGYLLGGDGWDSPDLVGIGGTSVEGGYFTNHFSKDDKRPEVKDFVAAYTAKFGAAPDALGALGYDASNILFDAIKRAGSIDRAAIRDALKTTSFNTVSGKITFDADRNPIKSAVIIKVKNGQQAYQATVRP